MNKLEALGNRVGDYLNVTKPAIALLNIFVGIAAILLASGASATSFAILVTATAGFLSAGGAGAINCYVDRELDKHMTRTQHRPVPTGRVEANTALAMGVVLSAGGIVLAAFFLNLLTAFFIGMGVFWYVFVYTLWLKPRTKWNIVIGGAAGCFSALGGWSAATGTTSLEAFLLAALIFLWTPGHFWGLAIANAEDYKNVEVPMLPVVEGVPRASFHTSLSNILLFPFTMALYLLTVNWTNILAAAVMGTILVVLNLRFLAANVKLIRTPSPKAAWRVFKFSAGYLFVCLLLIVLGHLL